MVAVSFDYAGTRVLVTGGSNGIGLGVATAFREAGAHVTITGTRGSSDDYDHDLSGFAYHRCRLPDPDAVRPWSAASTALDVLVNNAGQNLPGGRSEYDPEVFEEVVAVNLFAAFRMAIGVPDHSSRGVSSMAGPVWSTWARCRASSASRSFPATEPPRPAWCS